MFPRNDLARGSTCEGGNHPFVSDQQGGWVVNTYQGREHPHPLDDRCASRLAPPGLAFGTERLDIRLRLFLWRALAFLAEQVAEDVVRVRQGEGLHASRSVGGYAHQECGELLYACPAAHNEATQTPKGTSFQLFPPPTHTKRGKKTARGEGRRGERSRARRSLNAVPEAIRSPESSSALAPSSAESA